jgi:hypothetical protein
MDFGGTPQEVTVGGKSFWKDSAALQTPGGTRYGSQFVAVDKGYLLTFSFSALDSPKLENLREIEKSLETVQFLASEPAK